MFQWHSKNQYLDLANTYCHSHAYSSATVLSTIYSMKQVKRQFLV